MPNVPSESESPTLWWSADCMVFPSLDILKRTCYLILHERLVLQGKGYRVSGERQYRQAWEVRDTSLDPKSPCPFSEHRE